MYGKAQGAAQLHVELYGKMLVGYIPHVRPLVPLSPRESPCFHESGDPLIELQITRLISHVYLFFYFFI